MSLLQLMGLLVYWSYCEKDKGEQLYLVAFDEYNYFLNYNLMNIQHFVRRTFSSSISQFIKINYSRQSEINWVDRNLYSKYLQKINYLKAIEKQGMIQQYYKGKTINQLSQEEVIYFLNHKQENNLDRKRADQLIAMISHCFLKCLIYKELKWKTEISQYEIMLSFNEQVLDLGQFEISFCLETISNFSNSYDSLDFDRIAMKLQQTISKKDSYHLILICGYLMEMGIQLPSLITSSLVNECIKSNTNYDFRAIYFSYKLSEYFKIAIDEKSLEIFKSQMKKAVLNISRSEFDKDYLIFLLTYYPENVKLLTSVPFTAKAYDTYLQFFVNNPTATIDIHPIPASVISTANYKTFYSILSSRIQLKFDTYVSLSHNLKQFFTYELHPFTSYLKLIQIQKINEKEIFYYIEETMTNLLQLKKGFNPGLLNKVSVYSIILTLDSLCSMKICSSSFWRKCLEWIEKLNQYEQLEGAPTKNNTYYICLYSIFIKKSYHSQVPQFAKQFMTSRLSNQSIEWTLRQLNKLANNLAEYKNGDSKIWIIIELRLLNFNIKNIKMNHFSNSIDYLIKIMMSLCRMRRGSYNFWQAMAGKLQSNQKAFIKQKIGNNQQLLNLLKLTNG